jgi:iron complex outermembrane receptor protein
MDLAGKNNVLTLQGDLYKQEDGERVSANTYVPPVNSTIDGNEELSGGNVLFRWSRKISNTNDFQLQAYYDRTNRHELNFGDRLNTFDLDIQDRTQLPWRQQLIYGLEGRVSPGRFLEVVSGLVFSPADRTDFLISGFSKTILN